MARGRGVAHSRDPLLLTAGVAWWGMVSRRERAEICGRLLQDAATLRHLGDRALAHGDPEMAGELARVVADLLALAGLLLDRRSSRKSG